MKPYQQKNIKLTKAQLELVNELTSGMQLGSRGLFIQTLICQRHRRLRSDYENWPGVPLPYETFIKVYCRTYSWDDVSHLMNRAPYDKDNGVCFRYKVHEDILDRFIKAGEEHLLSYNHIQKEPFYDLSGKPYERKLNRDPNRVSHKLATQVDLGYGISWLQREKQWLESAQISVEERERYYRRYLHNLSCFQGIVERIVYLNNEKRQAVYVQELVQPDEGLRFYEKGGGLQGASRNFREYLLFTSPVLNVDAVKCHATIAHDEMTKLGIDSGLQGLLEGNVSIEGSKLTNSTIKTAILAVINGAKLVKKLTEHFTIPSLVINDPNLLAATQDDKQKELNLLVSNLNGIASAIKTWSKTLPKHNRIATVSAVLQELEVKYLAPLKTIATNDQHDGAILPNNTSIPNTNTLKLQPKPISDADTRFSETVNEKTYEFVSFNTNGPKNMFDAIVATGTRLQACTAASHTYNNTPKNPDNSSDSAPSSGLGWLFG